MSIEIKIVVRPGASKHLRALPDREVEGTLHKNIRSLITLIIETKIVIRFGASKISRALSDREVEGSMLKYIENLIIET